MITIDKADEITPEKEIFQAKCFRFCDSNTKVILLHCHNIFSTLFKIYLLRGTTSYVLDTQPIPDADDSQKVEQRDDIVIPETPEQTNDENRNKGNDPSIENKQMQSGSDRYLISNISH